MSYGARSTDLIHELDLVSLFCRANKSKALQKCLRADDHTLIRDDGPNYLTELMSLCCCAVVQINPKLYKTDLKLMTKLLSQIMDLTN